MGVNGAHLCERWAGFKKGQKTLQGALWPLDGYFNGAFRKIPDPSGKLKKLCLAVGPVSVSNTLDVAFNENVNVMNHNCIAADDTINRAGIEILC
jgi:hypothetical protein